MEQKTICKSITLVIVFDSLHDKFEIITIPLFHFDDKDLEEIQQIVTSTKAANFAKSVVKIIVNLFMMVKKRHPKKTAKSKLWEDRFNSGKKSYSVKDYSSFISNKRKSKELTKETKRS